MMKTLRDLPRELLIQILAESQLAIRTDGTIYTKEIYIPLDDGTIKTQAVRVCSVCSRMNDQCQGFCFKCKQRDCGDRLHTVDIGNEIVQPIHLSCLEIDEKYQQCHGCFYQPWTRGCCIHGKPYCSFCRVLSLSCGCQ